MRFTVFQVALAVATFAMAFVWAYGPTAAVMADKWATDPQYSHGFLVPVFAAYLLWHRRQLFPKTPTTVGVAGMIAMGCGVALHLTGAYLYIDALSALSVVPLLIALCLLCGGWGTLRWAWPSIGFLLFMLPLPFRLEIALSHPLQRLATLCGTYCLQTMGLAVVAEGNIIIMENARIGVVEACNGLGMLVTFFAMTVGTVLLVRRSFIEKAVILLQRHSDSVDFQRRAHSGYRLIACYRGRRGSQGGLPRSGRLADDALCLGLTAGGIPAHELVAGRSGARWPAGD